MNRFRQVGLLSVTAILALSGTAKAHAVCKSTDPIIEFTARHIAIGFGYLWGHGTLYDGPHKYSLTIRGGGMPGVGGILLEGTGCVRNLARITNFNGTYWTVGGTATINHGTAGIVMENAQGVDIQINAKTKGAQLSGQIGRLCLHLGESK